MLLFVLALQGSLQRADGAADGATVVTVADDVAIVGRADALRNAVHSLTGADGVRAAGLAPRSPKCVLAAGRAQECAAQGMALPAELGIKRAAAGATFAGTPFGTDKHVEDTVGKYAEDTVARVGTLMGLPLEVQLRMLLLHMLLPRRVAHLQRTVP